MKTKLQYTVTEEKPVPPGNLQRELKLGHAAWQRLSQILDVNLELAICSEIPETEDELERWIDRLRSAPTLATAVIYAGGQTPRGIVIPPEGIPLVGQRVSGKPSSLYQLQLSGAFVAENGGKLFDNNLVETVLNLARQLGTRMIAVFPPKKRH